MRADWPILTLGDVCEKITDGAHASPKTVAEGMPMASVKDLTRFGVDLTKARLIDIGEYEKLVKQGCQPEVGDVLIAKDGNSALDTVCTVDEPLDAVMLSSVAILRPEKNKLDSDFLKYYFNSEHVIDYLKSNFISGAAIPRVVLKDFRKAEIKVPPLNIQKSISKKLRMIDDKIELNRQANQTLEHIAQALFKCWFVDFEPTRAKIIAKEKGANTATQELAAQTIICGAMTLEQLEAITQNLETTLQQAINEKLSHANQPSINTEQLKTTAALFPSELVNSELGKIPEGWENKKLGDFVSLQGGLSYKSSYMGSGIPMVTMGCIDPNKRFKSDKLKYYSGEFKVQHRLKPGDLVISTRDVTQERITLGAPALIPEYLGDEIILATNMYKLVNTGLYLPNEYLFEILRTSRYREQIIASAKGTTVLMLTKDALLKYKIAYPSSKLIKYASNIFEGIYVKVEQLNRESDNLSRLRDGLLPKLLSGELSVSSD